MDKSDPPFQRGDEEAESLQSILSDTLFEPLIADWRFAAPARVERSVLLAHRFSEMADRDLHFRQIFNIFNRGGYVVDLRSIRPVSRVGDFDALQDCVNAMDAVAILDVGRTYLVDSCSGH